MSDAAAYRALGDATISNLKGSLGTESSRGGGKIPSWLEALATAMGEAQNDIMMNMIGKLRDIKNTAGEASKLGDGETQADKNRATEQSQKFQLAMTEFQAMSQMYSMLTNANSTSLKAVGEALTSLARKS